MAVETAESEMCWHMSVQEMPHKGGFSYPVFVWSYGFKKGIRGGELRAWSLQGIFIFTDRREPIEMPEGGWRFETIDDVLAKLDEYGWGKPPHIDEVFKQTIETNAKFPLPSDTEDPAGEAERIFENITQEWKTLAAS